MQYFISFLEGITTFISPCLLPMLPIYISYFMGDGSGINSKKTMINALGFVVGFSFVFILLGGFAGWLGSYLLRYQTVVNIVTGAAVIIFGLNFLGVIRLSLINKTVRPTIRVEGFGFWRAVFFGIVFSVGWTPCVGTFLGSALMLASHQASAWKGIIMLICYSAGLGLPFLLSAVFIGRLKGTFEWIKKHYQIINRISGLFLIAIGIIMMTGLMGRLLAFLS